MLCSRRHVNGRGREIVIADDRPYRVAAELAVLRRIYLFIQAGLGNFRRVDEVVQEFLFRRVQHFNRDVFPEIRAVHQEFESAPGGFQLLKRLVVQHFVHLGGQAAVYFRNHVIHGQFTDFLTGVGGLEHFFNKSADAQAGGLISLVLGGQRGLPDDGVKQ